MYILESRLPERNLQFISGTRKRKPMKMIWAKREFLRYDSDRESYYTEELLITEENGGKFRIVETKNPENYKGNYDKNRCFLRKKKVR